MGGWWEGGGWGGEVRGTVWFLSFACLIVLTLSSGFPTEVRASCLGPLLVVPECSIQRLHMNTNGLMDWALVLPDTVDLHACTNVTSVTFCSHFLLASPILDLCTSIQVHLGIDTRVHVYTCTQNE